MWKKSASVCERTSASLHLLGDRLCGHQSDGAPCQYSNIFISRKSYLNGVWIFFGHISLINNSVCLLLVIFTGPDASLWYGLSCWFCSRHQFNPSTQPLVPREFVSFKKEKQYSIYVSFSLLFSFIIARRAEQNAWTCGARLSSEFDSDKLVIYITKWGEWQCMMHQTHLGRQAQPGHTFFQSYIW